MARNAARLKMGFYPLPISEAMRLRALLEFTGPASVVDPCVGQGTALEIITEGAEVRRYGVELDAERAVIAQSKGIETIQGNAFDAVAKPESFSLLYLNPPYDSEIGQVANNRMERLFLDHTYRWLAMNGVLAMVIPFERLSGRFRRREASLPLPAFPLLVPSSVQAFLSALLLSPEGDIAPPALCLLARAAHSPQGFSANAGGFAAGYLSEPQQFHRSVRHLHFAARSPRPLSDLLLCRPRGDLPLSAPLLIARLQVLRQLKHGIAPIARGSRHKYDAIWAYMA